MVSNSYLDLLWGTYQYQARYHYAHTHCGIDTIVFATLGCGYLVQIAQHPNKMSVSGSQPPTINTTPRRRARSITEQNYLLRFADEINEDVEVPSSARNFIDLPLFKSPSAKEKFLKSMASGVEKVKNLPKPQLFKNVSVSELPLGMSVYKYQCVAFCILTGVFFTRWSCYLIYAFMWSVQLSALYFSFSGTKRPNYDATRRRYHTHAKLFEANGVTILKPLHGVPERLAANLETYFTLRYPKFELLLCIKEKKGQEKLIELCESLMKKYPHVDCIISYGYQSWGVNPKLCNMGTGYEIAKYDLTWVADANIVASDCVIQDLVEKCVSGEKVALVHQIPWMISGPGKTTNDPHSSMGYITGGSVLDRWYFATGHSRCYFVINNIFCTCLNGMSSIVKRQALESVGGLEHFAQFVAEDAEIGNSLDAAGYSSMLCAHAGLQNLAETSFATFIDRRVRWARLRYNMPKVGMTAPFEILTEAHWYQVLLAMALCWHHDMWMYVVPVALVHAAAWCLVDGLQFALLDRSIGLPEAWEDTPNNNLFFDWGKVSTESGGLQRFMYNLFRHYILWIVREVTVFIIIAKALSDISAVAWGGKKFELRGGKSSTSVRQMKNK